MAIWVGQLQRPLAAHQGRLVTQLDHAAMEHLAAAGLRRCGDAIQIGYPQTELLVGQVLGSLIRGPGSAAVGGLVVEAFHAGA